MLLKKNYMTKSWRLSTKMHETGEYFSGVLVSMQRSESKVPDDVLTASVSRKKKCVEGCERYLVRDEVRLFLGQKSKRAKSAGAAALNERSLARMLDELCTESGWRHL